MANSGSRINGSPSSVTSAPTPRLNERHSLWTSLNRMDAVNRETELEDGSGGEANQRCTDSEGPGVLGRVRDAVDSSATKAIEQRAAAIESSNYPMLNAIRLPLLNQSCLLLKTRHTHSHDPIPGRCHLGAMLFQAKNLGILATRVYCTRSLDQMPV
jgi:hypothetical protein